MKTSTYDQLENRCDSFTTSQPIFRNLILFEDDAVLDRAKQLHEHLFRQAKERCRLETFNWNLKHLPYLEEFVEAVTMSDMIIVAGSENSEFPDEIHSALKVGLGARRAETGALVALLGTTAPHEKPSELHLRLQELATNAGLKFFPGTFELEPFAPQRASKRGVAPMDIDYGINE